MKAIYPDDGDGDGDQGIPAEAVPGLRPETGGATSLTLAVDGETFALRRNECNGTDYTWLSGPNPGYGFGMSPTLDLSLDEHRENSGADLGHLPSSDDGNCPRLPVAVSEKRRGSRRADLLGRLCQAVGSVTVAHPVRVAVDGPPAAGKTTLADELAVVLREQGRDVIRATIDDFLFPRAQRYPRGEYSAEGCYFDAHDYGALNRILLDPLGPGGDRNFQPAAYDRTADAVLSPSVNTAPADAVLVFDGVFLMRPELIDRWDLRILVDRA
ncbi:hypothetical protein F4558_006189 [Micromonospora profundi]|nr:hypothetical protein [Micromonospora profundi]